MGFSACSGLKVPLGSHHSAATFPNLETSASTMEGPVAVLLHDAPWIMHMASKTTISLQVTHLLTGRQRVRVTKQ